MEKIPQFYTITFQLINNKKQSIEPLALKNDCQVIFFKFISHINFVDFWWVEVKIDWKWNKNYTNLVCKNEFENSKWTKWVF